MAKGSVHWSYPEVFGEKQLANKYLLSTYYGPGGITIRRCLMVVGVVGRYTYKYMKKVIADSNIC